MTNRSISKFPLYPERLLRGAARLPRTSRGSSPGSLSPAGSLFSVRSVSTVNCKRALLGPVFTTTSINIVGEPTFLCLALPLSFFRILLNLKLTTYHQKLLNSNYTRTHERVDRKYKYVCIR